MRRPLPHPTGRFAAACRRQGGMSRRQRDGRRAVRSSLLALLLVVVTALVSSASSAAADGSCECLQAAPRKNAQPLVFCNWYRSASCCLPAHDADAQGSYLALIEAGDSCAKFQNAAKRFLAVAFCLACDPLQAEMLGAPLNDAFFDPSATTAKVCASVAARMAPVLFNDCGLTLPDDRNNPCSPTSPVVPDITWPDCENQQFVCQDADSKDWYCSADACGANNTPAGFLDAPCNSSEHTCGGVLMFLNDNRAAKPPNFEDYAVEIVNEEACLNEHDGNATLCRCLRDPNSATRNSLAYLSVLIALQQLLLLSL